MSPEKKPEELPSLDIQIWITPDGKIYFNNITADVIEVAYSLDPNNIEIARKYTILKKGAEK